MISLDNISFKYPKSSREIISGFSCSFSPGMCTAVTGKNGCGKTTLIRLITGMLRPCAGHILIDGRDTSEMDLFDIGRRVGCVFQDPSRQLFCPTVAEEVRYGLVNMGLGQEEAERRSGKYLSFFGLEHLRDAFPGTLSQGEKQRVVLSAVLAMGTGYVLLDEPTSGLDMDTRRALGEHLYALSRTGCGVIFVSHERAFIDRWADRELVIG